MSGGHTKEKDAHGHGGRHGAHEEHEEHEEHINHEAWVIPYADMLTLLMALFIVLFATSIMDVNKFKAAAQSLNEALGGAPLKGGVFESGGSSPVSGAPAPQKQGGQQASGTATPNAELAKEILDQQAAAAAARRAQAEKMAALEQQIAAKAQAMGFQDAINVREEARGLVITVVTDQVLFDAGRATLRDKGAGVLTQVGQVIKDVPNQIAIEGHTDSVPINTAQFPSNWELSTARATSVLRYMVDTAGLNSVSVAAGGYADQRPIDSNATADGRQRNRRVEIVILNPSQNPVGSSQVNPVAKGG